MNRRVSDGSFFDCFLKNFELNDGGTMQSQLP
jgi:hypothetical protein